MEKGFFEFEIVQQNVFEQALQPKLDEAKRRLTQTLNLFFESSGKSVFINSTDDLVLRSPDSTDIIFYTELTFIDPRIGGFYTPSFERLSNKREIFLNIFTLMRYSVDDIAYILLHEAIHAGILTGKENHDEASTDTFAVELCRKAGLEISFTSGYVELRNKLAKFGDRVNEWISKIARDESLLHESRNYREELAEAVVSLVFGDEGVSSLSWAYVREFIVNHKQLLEHIFPRLISLANRDRMEETGHLNIDIIEEYLQKKFAEQFFESEERKSDVIAKFDEFWSSAIYQSEDKKPDLEQTLVEFLSQNEAMYLFDFAKDEVLALVQTRFAAERVYRKTLTIDFTKLQKPAQRAA